ncbi:MAG: GNAT family N-acetyltransferase [Microbacterium sp.]|uniref:GNAT family N-acetyltransferase n=1 Tax=Microbacterium sp. TaxID=51671 RepID=UPI003F7E49C1
MTFTLRAPVPADAEELAALHVSTWQEAYTELLPEGFFDEAFLEGRRRMWAQITAEPREDLIVRVAEQEGRIIGFAVSGRPIGPFSDEAPRQRQLYMIYLTATSHGGGAGQSLLDGVLGDGPAQLWVAKDNPRAVAFYRRNGFEFDGVEHVDPATPLLVEARMLR